MLWISGTLKVHLMRTIVPRSLFNRFHLPLAILQQASLIFQLLLSLLLFKFPGTMPQFVSSRLTSAPPMPGFDLFFIDQLSAGIPWLRILSATRVVFYCHFPDKEIGRAIAKQRAAGSGGGGPSVLRKLYRIPLDLYEEATTGKCLPVALGGKEHARSAQRARNLTQGLGGSWTASVGSLTPLK